MLKRIKGLVAALEAIELSPQTAVLAVLLAGTLKYIFEQALVPFGAPVPIEAMNFRDGLSSFLDYPTFYVTVFLYFLVAQKAFLKRTYYAPILLGFVLIFAPPVIDVLLHNQVVYHYPVEPNLLFMGPAMPPGELLAIYAGLLVFAFYIAVREGKPLLFLPALFVIWALGQAGGSLHYIAATRLADTFSLNDDAVFFFGRLGLFLAALLYLDGEFRAFVKYRFSRIFLVVALSLFSALIFGAKASVAISLCGAALLAALLAMMLNEGHDAAEDKANGRRKFAFNGLTWTILALSLLVALVVFYLQGIGAYYAPLGMVVLAFLYGQAPRLKRYFPLAYLAEGLGFSLIFSSFFLGQVPAEAPNPGFWWRTALCFITFSVGSAIKDCKDVKGDGEAGVQTPFTMLEGRALGWFWLAYRAVLVLGPLLFVFLEKGCTGGWMGEVMALFAGAAIWLLFFSKQDETKMVDYYVACFSLLLLLSSIAC